MSDEKKWLNVHDVVALTGLSKPMAYVIMRRVNAIQKAEGKLTVHGKVSRKKLLELIE